MTDRLIGSDQHPPQIFDKVELTTFCFVALLPDKGRFQHFYFLDVAIRIIVWVVRGTGVFFVII